jgi:hypothetical protein
MTRTYDSTVYPKDDASGMSDDLQPLRYRYLVNRIELIALLICGLVKWIVILLG